MKVYIGRFTEKDIASGKDQNAVERGKKNTGFQYTRTDLVKKKGQIVAMDIWVCDLEDADMSTAV